MYRTKDLQEAAALQTVGFVIDKLVWSDRECYFIFNNPDAQLAGNDYYLGELMVNARQYSSNLKTLRDRVFQSKEFRGGRI